MAYQSWEHNRARQDKMAVGRARETKDRGWKPAFSLSRQGMWPEEIKGNERDRTKISETLGGWLKEIIEPLRQKKGSAVTSLPAE